MCVVSNVGDMYGGWYPQKYPEVVPQVSPPIVIAPVTREEFDALRQDVLDMKKLLLAAKQIDTENGNPECEVEDKIALLKKIAEVVGVDLEEVFG